MACKRWLRQWNSIFKLKNSLGLLILCISLLSVCFTLRLIYLEEDEDSLPAVHDTWTPVVGLQDTYAFNAYFTGRDNLVRILGVGPTHAKPKVSCTFHRKGDVPKDNEVSDNKVLGTLVQMIDAHNKSYNNIEILCPLQSGDPPYAVSLSGLETFSEFYLKIHYPPTVITKLNFSVCTPAIHSNYSESAEIIQSVELDSLFGAQRFTFYYQSASPEVDAILRMYRDNGVVKLVPWVLPKVNVHYFAQVTSVRDCFYRNMHTSKYVVFKDLDEVLLPYKHSGWNSLIDDILKDDPQAAAFIFKNSFVHKLSPDVTESINKEVVDAAKNFGLYAILKQFRQTVIWPYPMRSKFIVNPTRVNNVEIHQIRAVRKAFSLAVVNETLGLMFHYRKTVDRSIKTVKDPAMRRFKDILIDRVDNIYYILNSRYKTWQRLFP